MNTFSDNAGSYYPYPPSVKGVHIISLLEIKPPQRDSGVLSFRKYKLIPVLLALRSPECALPPIEVTICQEAGYQYFVNNGYHRYYASVAVGYTDVPAIVRN